MYKKQYATTTLLQIAEDLGYSQEMKEILNIANKPRKTYAEMSDRHLLKLSREYKNTAEMKAKKGRLYHEMRKRRIIPNAVYRS